MWLVKLLSGKGKKIGFIEKAARFEWLFLCFSSSREGF